MIRPALSIFVDANPDWYGRRAPRLYGRLARTLLSAHVTIATSPSFAWWIPKP